ncbi:MAG: ABC transporter ATP-binding protein [Deltaproteobacteria bacterium]|nr:ABC transporter ATP-binding protein [Deltaproteobacteria bacterium]
MTHHIIDFKDIFFQYPDGTEALKGVSFRIIHGESVGLVGANGAGKSTLLLQMNGYMLPSSGVINIGGVELTKKTRQDIRKKVGVVFQNPDDQLFMPTVFDDVAFGPLNLGMSNERVTDRVNSALQTIGCLDLATKPPHHLSAGKKRAVSIATVLAMEPDILAMDEPSSNLDPKSRRDLIGLLKEFKHTKIIASHDLDLILEVCERCLVIKNGMIVADGRVSGILTNQLLLEENHLELPLSLQKNRIH